MHDIIIIGGGPAGLTAAIYSLRAGKSVLVIERENTGGQIVYSPLIENYPALSRISGAEFAQQLTSQVEGLGAAIEYSEAHSVLKKEFGYTVLTDMGGFDCKSVIIATGVRHRRLNIEGEQSLVGAGISYCAVCDGAFFRNRSVAVAGGGNSALTEALFLANFCKKVTLIVRRDVLRGEACYADKLFAKDNVSILFNSNIKDFIRDDRKLTGLILKDNITDQQFVLDIDGLFIAIGREPQSETFADVSQMDEKGYFVTREDMSADRDGIFIAGDCRKKPVRQLTTAVSDGAIAGIFASRYIDSLK